MKSCSLPRPFRLWSFVTSHPSLSFDFLTVRSVIKKQRAQRVQMKSGKTIHMCYTAGTVNPEGSDNSVVKGILSPMKVNAHLRKTHKSVQQWHSQSQASPAHQKSVLAAALLEDTNNCAVSLYPHCPNWLCFPQSQKHMQGLRVLNPEKIHPIKNYIVARCPNAQ